ncbi:MAG: DNA-3-methyladenine glycosylase 2 family protein [Gemmatimonadetes bacterium]|nr:DNA-3-methyladenine glycosylase 2 family protein [Gemmatimonadota bacterium]
MSGVGDVVWPEASDRLLADPAFGPLVEEVGPVRFEARAPDTFSFLVRAVTYQQLAGKAAATIHGRLVEALEGEVTPAAVLSASEEALRGAGLSRAKMASIVDLATRVDSGDVRLDDIEGLDDGAVVERLVRVRGIGRWTAEMALLFHLRRPDVWPVTDLGVRAGAARLFGMDEPPAPGALELMGLGYRPWRSAAAWYCWRAVDVRAPG